MVEITPKAIVRPDGQSVFGFGLDLSTAPVPPRRYLCDAADLVEARGQVRLLLGQRKVTDPGVLRSLLVVHMVRDTIRQLVISANGMNHPTISEIIARTGAEPEEAFKVSEEPAQTVAVTANMAAIALSGEEAVIDLYHASAFSVSAAQHAKKIAVEPVVRIDLSLSIFVGLLSCARLMAMKWPKVEGLEVA